MHLISDYNRRVPRQAYTKPVGWWGDGSQKILGGRDGLAGGTWLGCTRTGRLAFRINVLETDNIPTAKSRGDLTVKFLECGKSPLDFAEEVANEADKHNGFNLILADLCSKTMVYVSNRPNGEPVSIVLVTAGLHMLTNAGLDTPWHKALRLGKGFKEVLYKYDEQEIPATEMVDKLMTDRVKADRDCLPNTGCDPSWELDLSPVFVELKSTHSWGDMAQGALLFWL
ncbi:hypothetical protein Taro_006952 [Colocasia esculenta]|uniref:Uncharacterized protein n=1 Tax=Colocasia esculenta TaxID=4460 RepID=A0A843TSQ0_COLES|nr:hypothetical protein [Colocasia esculenta]